MAARPAAKAAFDCPAWCRVHHDAGAKFHAHCVGELHWRQGSVLVTVTRHTRGDGIELAYHVKNKAPAIALLNGDEVRELRDYLNDALEALDGAEV